MKIKTSEFVLLLGLGIVLIGAAYYFLFYLSWTERMGILDEQCAEISLSISTIEEKQAKIGKILEQIKEAETSENMMLLSDSKYNQSTILTALEEIYIANNLDVSTSTRFNQDVVEGGGLVIVPLEARISGDNKDLLKVIKDLESEKLSGRITTIRIGFNLEESKFDLTSQLEYAFKQPTVEISKEAE